MKASIKRDGRIVITTALGVILAGYLISKFGDLPILNEARDGLGG